jgi:hypothetical protein
MWLLAMVVALAGGAVLGPNLFLQGTLTDGFVRLLLFPALPADSPSSFPGWCTSKKVGDYGSVELAYRANRCINPFILLNTPVTAFDSLKNFSGFQSNGTHIDLLACDDAACTVNCIHSVLPDLTCAVATLNVGTFPLSLVRQVHFVTDLFVLPSPALCSRVWTGATCTGETLIQMCAGSCIPVTNGATAALMRFDCIPDGSGAIVLSVCPFDPKNPLATISQCQAAGFAPCAGAPPVGVPAVPGGCAAIAQSGYGFQTVGCTVASSDSNLHAHTCSGMDLSAGATCSANGVTLDGRFPKTVEGSWAADNAQFTIQDLQSNVTPVTCRGTFAPNGRLVLSFSSPAALALVKDKPVPLVSYTGVSSNYRSATEFTSTSAVVQTPQGAQPMCASANYGTAATLVTVSDCGLPLGAIIGIAVGCVVVGVAAAIVIVKLTMWQHGRYAIASKKSMMAREVGGLAYVRLEPA